MAVSVQGVGKTWMAMQGETYFPFSYLDNFMPCTPLATQK